MPPGLDHRCRLGGWAQPSASPSPHSHPSTRLLESRAALRFTPPLGRGVFLPVDPPQVCPHHSSQWTLLWEPDQLHPQSLSPQPAVPETGWTLWKLQC